MILLVDNYDSFTFNLVQYLAEMGAEVRTARNDAITVDEIRALAPNQIVVSPGPCTPAEAGISIEVIRELGPTIPILGVCLGHQSIGAAFGGHVIRAPLPVHGKLAAIHHFGNPLFAGVPSPFRATRYHSLIIQKDTCPPCLEIIAETGDGLIMGVAHKEFPVWGVQFHPESILTEHGKTILGNFLRLKTDSEHK